MQFARVLGTVAATVKHESLVGVRLMAIQPEDEAGNPDGDVIVAADPLQSGPGDLIEWTTGREAALALPVPFSPVDCSVVRIVDARHSDASLASGRPTVAQAAAASGARR